VKTPADELMAAAYHRRLVADRYGPLRPYSHREGRRRVLRATADACGVPTWRVVAAVVEVDGDDEAVRL
jgi:hypothetical protein